jgi:hypothetical protein
MTTFTKVNDVQAQVSISHFLEPKHMSFGSVISLNDEERGNEDLRSNTSVGLICDFGDISCRCLGSGKNEVEQSKGFKADKSSRNTCCDCQSDQVNRASE